MNNECKMDVTCQSKYCPNFGENINTIMELRTYGELELFCEAYGNGAEEKSDHCPICNQLGYLEEVY